MLGLVVCWGLALDMVNLRIVSLGSLAAHPLRDEKSPRRLGHGTTTLVEIPQEGKRIVVDPALPGDILRARLEERTGLGVEAITHVFLTSFRPDLRQGLALFEDATIWISEREREAVGVALVEDFRRLEEGGVGEGEEMAILLREEIALLQRCDVAPDKLGAGVDLFPLPGRTPGLCGLIVAEANSTIVICGDAVATIEHLEAGKVLADCVDVKLAQESFKEAIEIADVLVLGRDNMVMNPMRGLF